MAKKKALRKSKLSVPIFIFKPKPFEKIYGKKTKAATAACSPKKRECEIHIRSGLTKTDFKNTITHELGHIVTEKARVASRIPQTERRKLRELARTTLPRREFIHKREPTREMLAIIYEKLKQKNKSQIKVINQHVPQTKKLVEEAIRKIQIRRELIRVKKK